MPFVLDASVALSWALEDEDHSVAIEAASVAQSDEAVVPALWWFEVRNGLLISEIKKRSTDSRTASALKTLARLPIRTDPHPSEDEMFRLARRHALTIYDAAYLELAVRGTFPMATLDRALIKAARAEQVPLIGD
jgi:predicted nucleic acid-binding protein